VGDDGDGGDGATAERIPEVVARAALLPMVTSIRPGKPFWLALRLDIHPGYRVSWTYPGDIGREIRVAFEAPEGFEVGRVVYPAPERFAVGEYQAFGWMDRTAAFVQIRPPKRLSTQDAYRFDVKADWLACKKECLRESTQAYVELEASPRGGRDAKDPELAALRARVPRAFEDDKDARHEWQRGARKSVRLSVEGVTLSEFIPATEAEGKIVRAMTSRADGALVLTYEGRPGEPPHTTSGVVLGERGGEPVSYELAIPWVDATE
jgi:hypothetical protein